MNILLLDCIKTELMAHSCKWGKNIMFYTAKFSFPEIIVLTKMISRFLRDLNNKSSNRLIYIDTTVNYVEFG